MNKTIILPAFKRNDIDVYNSLQFLAPEGKNEGGTFYDINELPGRDMSEIPHPFIVESMEILDNVTNKASVYFIHLNHTNPALDRQSNAIKMIKNSGFNIAKRDQRFHL